MPLVDVGEEDPQAVVEGVKDVQVSSETDKVYPYDLCMYFKGDLLDKFEILQELPPDAEVKIEGVGYLKAIAMSNKVGDARERVSVVVQVKSIAFEPYEGEKPKRLQDMGMKEYSKARGKSYG